MIQQIENVFRWVLLATAGTFFLALLAWLVLGLTTGENKTVMILKTTWSFALVLAVALALAGAAFEILPAFWQYFWR